MEMCDAKKTNTGRGFMSAAKGGLSAIKIEIEDAYLDGGRFFLLF